MGSEMCIRDRWFKTSNTAEDDWSDLIGMLRVVNPEEELSLARVREVIDVEQWLTDLAVMALFNNSESSLNTGFNDDYYFYRGVDDPRFLLVAYDTEIVEIMTPRTRTEFLNVDLGADELVSRFRQLRHTRVPVFRTHRDNLVGFMHAEHILQLLSDGADLQVLPSEDLLDPPVVVPLTKKVDEMFDFFRDNGVRAAACLNEFGGVEGFITIYDVLTFIFGDISGESQGQGRYHERDLNIYELPGEMKLTDVNNLTNFGLEDPRMTTIGGVAFRYLDRLPMMGDRVVVDDVALTVLDMDAHRIARVRVAKVSAEEDFEDLSEAERHELKQELEADEDSLDEDGQGRARD